MYLKIRDEILKAIQPKPLVFLLREPNLCYVGEVKKKTPNPQFGQQ